MYVPPYHNQQPMAKLLSPSGIIMMFFIFCQIYILPITQATAQLPFLSYFCDNDRGNYTRNSTYHANLNHILSTFPSQNDNGCGFYSLSYGNSSDQVHLIGLCRGGANPNICSGCLNNATQLLPEICPNQKEAVGWHDYCMLRYSNRSMLGIMETYQKLYLWNDLNVSSNVDEFFRDLQTLLDGLKNRAASGGSLRKFATGNASGPDFQTLYALVQCTPDLSHQDCNNCLDDAFADIPECCDGKIGGRVIGTNCNFRYEIRLFYSLTDDTSLVSAPPPLAPTVYPPSPPSTRKNTSTGGRKESNASRRNVIIDVVSSSVGAAVLIIFICAFLKGRRVKQNVETRPSYEVEEIESVESLQYSFETIRVATDNFTDANNLGQGGFGFVYRGRLSNGQDIAVKRLSKDSGQGDLEFKKEVLLVAKLQHRNLVKLLDFCLKENERLLVYEFVRNASLDHFIFDPSKRANLNWETRHKIIGGIARGLLYLHEDSRLRIIHRDLKASNILLDEEIQPKISDFGMTRLFVVDQTQDSTSRIVGTYGYMAPEYALHGHFSVKIDAFSFGVLLLEIVSGQKNNCFRNGEHVVGILSYAWRNWRDKTASNVIDPLMRVNSSSEIMRCIHIALLCVQENVALRPTMNAVVLMLNSYSMSLPLPSKPAFSMHSNTGSDMPLTSNFNSRVTESDHSKSQSVQASTSETLITELHPR